MAIEVGDLVTAEMLDLMQNPPVVRLVASGTQSIPDNTATALQFSTGSTVIDTHNFHDESTNNTRITPTIAGIYEAYGSYFSAAMTTPVSRSCYVRFNGTTNIPPGPRDTGASITSSKEASCILEMNGSSDYIELIGIQDSNGAVNTNASLQQTSVFQLKRIGPLPS